MGEASKPKERRVTLNELTRGSPRPVDPFSFHSFTSNWAFRKKLYGAFCALLDDEEGRLVLEAFRAVVEKRMSEPWTPEYGGGMTMALIASVNKYDSKDDRNFYRNSGFPKKALDDDFVAHLKRGFNELCNSYAVYSIAVIEHGSFLKKIKDIGRDMDNVTEKELMEILIIGIAQYAQRNLHG